MTTTATEVSPAFLQAAVTAMERTALYLIPHLSDAHERRLTDLLWDIRRTLRFPPPRHPLFHLRDWPDDTQAGDALGALLARLEDLEVEPTKLGR